MTVLGAALLNAAWPEPCPSLFLSQSLRRFPGDRNGTSDNGVNFIAPRLLVLVCG